MTRLRDGSGSAIAAFALLGLLLIGLVGYGVYDQIRVNRINDNFTVHCRQIGGTAVIQEKDMCIAPDGRVIDTNNKESSKWQAPRRAPAGSGSPAC